MEVDGSAYPFGGGPRWRTWTLVAMAILGAATVAALVLALAESNRQRDRAAAAQAHSYDVMIVTRTLAGSIARAEASLGRYVISTDRKLGQLYVDDWRAASLQIERLAKLTADNDAQRGAIARLRAAFAQRGKELSVTALSTTYRKNGQALARYYKAREAPALLAIDRTLKDIIGAERRLLVRRTSTADRAGAQAAAAARILSLFGVGIVLGAILLGVLTVRALADRAAARAAADAAEARAGELAEAVARATDELRAQEAKLRQGQKMEAIGQLTGGIAHDFNNMLAVVLGGLELAKRHAGDRAAVTRYADSAMEGATRAAALTRQLLAFSREESLRPEVMDLGQLVRGMSELLDRTLGDGVTTRFQDDARGWRVHADRVQLENALLNLAVNARDAMNARGELTVRTASVRLEENAVGHCPAGDYVGLSVADSGCGMTPEVADRVFEPFFTTKPIGKGTGLGLSQVFALVRQLGGGIAIQTAPGLGSTVTLYLPRHAGELRAILAPEAPAAVGADRPALRILLVEDDPRVLAATTGALEELGHEVLSCDDPLGAPAALAGAEGVDLVVSDVLMPRQTGPEMVAGLLARQSDLAVLYVTGYAGEAGGAAEFGGRHVLRKPFTLAALERAVDAAVADAREHQVAAE